MIRILSKPLLFTWTRNIVQFHQADKASAITGIEDIVPILGGLGREEVIAELPALLQVKLITLSQMLE